MHMHYSDKHPLSAPFPLIVTCKASILSSVAHQLRFQMKGKTGSFTKFEVDVQEAQMKAFDPKGLLAGQPGWGEEKEEAWGTLETFEAGQWKSEK